MELHFGVGGDLPFSCAIFAAGFDKWDISICGLIAATPVEDAVASPDQATECELYGRRRYGQSSHGLGEISAEFVSTHFLVVHNDAQRSTVKHQPAVQIMVSNFSDSLKIFSIIQ